MLLAQISDAAVFRHPDWPEGDTAEMIVNDASQQDHQIVGSVTYKYNDETYTVSATESETPTPDPNDPWWDDRWEILAP